MVTARSARSGDRAPKTWRSCGWWLWQLTTAEHSRGRGRARWQNPGFSQQSAAAV